MKGYVLMYSDRYKYYRLTFKEKEKLLESIREVLRKRGIKLAIVFGSFVELESFRDIDVAVYAGLSELDLNTVLDIGVELEDKLRIPVDVIPLETAPARLKYYVLTKGVVVLEEESGLYEALLIQTLDELALLENVEDKREWGKLNT